MPYHTEVIIYEIIYLYCILAESDAIPLEVLEDTFYTVINIINKEENLKEEYDFSTELENLINALPESFSIDEDELTIEDKLENIYDEIMQLYENYTYIDKEAEEIVKNIQVYESLKIPIPTKEYQHIFRLNNYIINLYFCIISKETENKDIRVLLIYLYLNIENLKKEINELDELSLMKLKMCCDYYNSICFKNESYIPYIWESILFSNEKQKLLRLNYDKIEFLCEEKELEFFNEDKENTKDDYDYEIPTYLTYFIIYLNKYIELNKTYLSVETIKNLLTIKYLLISIPELKYIEEHLLNNITIDNLELPTLKNDWLNEKSFEIFLLNIAECLENSNYKDSEIANKPKLYSKLIINFLFIKCFLTLSINDIHKKSILNELTNNELYKNPNYEIRTNLIDTIIYSDSYNLTK